MSYRLIFGQDSKSATTFRQLDLVGRQFSLDPLLEILCGQPDTNEALQVLNRIRIHDPGRCIYPNDDFPFLGHRLVDIQQYMQATQPSSIRGLWYDRREPLLWWTFWVSGKIKVKDKVCTNIPLKAVVLVGVLTLFLSFLQVGRPFFQQLISM